MRRSGFTLIELLVSTSTFLLLVFVAFGVFEFGSKSCGTVSLRHNLQSAATRAMLNLQNDLRRSSYNTVQVVARGNPRRDAVCMAGMSSWTDPSALNTTAGLPSYDRYFVYYASDDGRLYRCTVQDPQPRDCIPRLLEDFAPDRYCRNDPRLNSPNQLAYACLAEDVESFQVEDLGSTLSIRASLSLHREGFRGPAGGAKRHDQTYQMEVELTPQNTWPRQ